MGRRRRVAEEVRGEGGIVSPTMARRSRSEAAGGSRLPQHERTPDGDIDNCALALGLAEGEEGCQVCGGLCPDKNRLVEREVLRNEPRGVASEKARANIAARIAVADEALEQRAGEEAFAAAADGLDEGQPVDVTIGDKLFKPADYNGFRSGTYKASTVVRKGESVGRAMLRLHAEMTAAARVIQEREAAQYCEDLAVLVRKVGGIRL